MNTLRDPSWGRASLVVLAAWLGAIVAGAWIAFQ